MRTPWGPSQHVETIANGIQFVSTASHGGMLLSPARFARMPAKHRKTFAGGRWFEEDCDAAKVVVAFPKHFTADQVKSATASVEFWERQNRTELTEAGEQHVMPGCERETTPANPQGGLWD